MGNLLRPYRFKHPQSDYVETLNEWSYLWASVFGAFYVLFKGFVGRFFLLLLVGLCLWLAAFFLRGILGHVPSYLHYALQFLVPIAVFMLQGMIAISVVRAGYLRRGWTQLN